MAKDKVNPIDEILADLIEMETNEMQAMISMRNAMNLLLANKKQTLITCGKKAGLDTGLLESLKVD